jgi:hypothetical protein
MSRHFGLNTTPGRRPFGKRPTVFLSKEEMDDIDRETAVIGWLVLCGAGLSVTLGVLFAVVIALTGLE